MNTSDGDPKNEALLRLRQDAVTWRTVGEEVVALDLGQSTYLGVNRTGAVLWDALSAGATRSKLTAVMLEHFDVDEGQAASDIEIFLADLSSRGLVEENPSS